MPAHAIKPIGLCLGLLFLGVGIAPGVRASTLQTTSGDIAVFNLESSLRAAWSDYLRFARKNGAPDRIVQIEQLKAQFLGDMESPDRLDHLAAELRRHEPEAGETYLLSARIAAYLHRFDEAEADLRQARRRGVPAAMTEPVRLSIQQATGERLAEVLAVRRRRAQTIPGIDELLPLAALLVDLGEYEEADRVYARALAQYRDVSPFPPAWVCFQRGVLWGERMPAPQPERARRYYEMALAYLPAYVPARVHLAELYARRGALAKAEALLTPGARRGDPESRWRLAQVLKEQGRAQEAQEQLLGARASYDRLLARHELAFADHAAEFYLGDGNDVLKALSLARRNLANRPTLRAFELAHEAAVRVGERRLAANLLAEARARLRNTKAFQASTLSRARTGHPTAAPSEGMTRPRRTP
ncbi:tetratricopeptide repeat protein [Sorangium sp. So ce429]